MNVFDEHDLAQLSPIFRGKIGQRFAEFIIKKLDIDKVNKAYNNSYSFSGQGFATNLLKDLGVEYLIGNTANFENLPQGAFITISNHPYGGLDGVILIDLMASVRKDYKLMVNKVLSLVKTMNGNFISVTPAGNLKKEITSTSIHGVRETMIHLQNGHPAGFFPSGAVSDFSLRELRIRDRKWQAGIIHLIRSARVPVLPIRFFDTNSRFFYCLGLINWRIRILKLPSELFNKSNQHPRIGIGRLITVEEQDCYSDIVSFGEFLRNAVYGMPLPESFIPCTAFHNSRNEVARYMVKDTKYTIQDTRF